MKQPVAFVTGVVCVDIVEFVIVLLIVVAVVYL